MFFFVLTGFILGLTLLANNLQGLLELLIAKIFFFWELRGMRILLGKNLAMHKSRNKLTSIIYALTLGCIIFLLVAAELQVQQNQTLNAVKDADITIQSTDVDKWKRWYPDKVKLTADKLDPVLIKHENMIKNFGYTTKHIEAYSWWFISNDGLDNPKFSDLARLYELT